jgi:hypothetical protein
MRVGLIGSPGSGKSDVAERLSDEYDLLVIDDYVPSVEQFADLALGYAADFLPNLLVPAERWKHERHAKDDYVTCGTHVESACYSAIWAHDNLKLFPEEKARILRQATITTDVIALYIATAWTYDSAFYLPLPQGTGTEFDQRLDFSIRDALAMMSIDYVTLDENDRAAQAIRLLKERYEVTDAAE